MHELRDIQERIAGESGQSGAGEHDDNNRQIVAMAIARGFVGDVRDRAAYRGCYREENSPQNEKEPEDGGDE